MKASTKVKILSVGVVGLTSATAALATPILDNDSFGFFPEMMSDLGTGLGSLIAALLPWVIVLAIIGAVIGIIVAVAVGLGHSFKFRRH